MDELINVNECPFGERCNRVKISKNNVKNKSDSSPCMYFHPNESENMFTLRHGVKNVDSMDRTKVNVEKYKFTRMCDKEACEDTECTYAHSIDELKVFPCKFGDECHFISKKDCCYENNKDDSKTCFFVHPEETMKNYEERVITKRKTEELKSKVKPDLVVKQIITESKVSKPVVNSKLHVVKPIVETKPKVVEPVVESNLQEKIVINVPIHMAKEMLEMMLKSGKTNFEIKTY